MAGCKLGARRIAQAFTAHPARVFCGQFLHIGSGEKKDTKSGKAEGASPLL